MSASVVGRLNWTMTRSNEGHRTYKLLHLVKTTSTSDGPAQVINAPNLPTVGSAWIFGNDFDFWAFCYPQATIRPVITNEPTQYWTLEQTFSTVPINRCQDQTIEDPLAEPQKISGSFTSYSEETIKDKDGALIKSSSHEPLTGIEKDIDRPTVRISQNRAALELDTLSNLINTVNDATLWGLSARKIKLSSITWERKVRGTCNFYYTRTFDFEINFDTWDSKPVDKGFKIFDTNRAGGSRTNPLHYVNYKDAHDENTPTPILLDGNGDALTDPSTPTILTFELYSTANFLTLGIPTTL